MALTQRSARCLLLRLLRAAWRHRPRCWPGRGAREAWRRARTLDLEALALQLNDFERQLGRARVGYAGKHLSQQQLQALCLCIVDEVHALLRPLDGASGAAAPSWAAQRLHEGLRHWHAQADAVAAQPLHPSDVSDLQAHLLEVSTALYVCARVEDRGGGW
jgi:hypothetical protein